MDCSVVSLSFNLTIISNNILTEDFTGVFYWYMYALEGTTPLSMRSLNATKNSSVEDIEANRGGADKNRA